MAKPRLLNDLINDDQPSNPGILFFQTHTEVAVMCWIYTSKIGDIRSSPHLCPVLVMPAYPN